MKLIWMLWTQAMSKRWE